MTEHERETTKADAIHTENNAYNPYSILTDEELQLMQAFEGKREKALTRKVGQREPSDLLPPKRDRNRISTFVLMSLFLDRFSDSTCFCVSLSLIPCRPLQSWKCKD